MSNAIITELDTSGEPYIQGKDQKALFDDIMNYTLNIAKAQYFVGDPGTGKCVGASEIITLANGMRIPAGGLIGKRFDLLTLVDGVVTPVTAHAELNAIETVYQIETMSGRTIVRNGQHPLWTANIGRNYKGNRSQLGTPGASSALRTRVNGWTAVQDIRAGDLVAVTSELPAFPLEPCGLSDAEICVLAYLIGDGGYTSTSGVRFSQKDNMQLAEFRLYAEQLGCELVQHDEYTYRVVGKNRGDNAILRLLQEYGMYGMHTRDKHFPAVVWSFDARQLALFLSRLYATDGWAYSGASKGNRAQRFQIGFCSISKALINDVQEALVRLGIASSIEQKLEKKYQVISWTLDVRSARDALKFIDTVGIYGKEAAINKVHDIATVRLTMASAGQWKHAKVVQGTQWEKVRYVCQIGIQPTVAIEVPEHHTFLTLFYEHNTHMMMQVACEYARQMNAPAFYTVLDEDSTKASVLLGHRIENGSLTTFKAVVAYAMERGGIVCVDELPHGPQSIQSVFNTVTDQNSKTSIGDLMVVGHPNFRVLFGGNRTKHIGNNALKPSFAGRLYARVFEYPLPTTETRIVKSIILQERNGEYLMQQIPDSVVKYAVGWARSVREFTHNLIPVSARNVAAAMESLALKTRDEHAVLLPEYASSGSSTKAAREKVAEWVYFKPLADLSTADLIDPKVTNVLAFISQLEGGKKTFELCLSEACMAYLDIDGIVPSKMAGWSQQMISSMCP